jgi:hypothetical protein
MQTYLHKLKCKMLKNLTHQKKKKIKLHTCSREEVQKRNKQVCSNNAEGRRGRHSREIKIKESKHEEGQQH